MRPDLFGDRTRIFQYFVRRRVMFFFLLLAVVLMVPIGQNIAAGELMIRGEESYYHLVKAQEAQWYEAQYLPLTWTLKILPEKGLIFLLFVMTFASLAMYFILERRLKIEPSASSCFLFFLILSPAFIAAYGTLSTAAFFTFLILCGFFFLTSRKKMRFLAILPFSLAVLFEIFYFMLTISLIAAYLHRRKERFKKEKDWSVFFVPLVIIILFTIALMGHEPPLMLGPFDNEGGFTNIISDFGSSGGISFLVLLLAFVGAMIAGKHPLLYSSYFFLLFVILAYVVNGRVLFFLSLLLIFFATRGFITLFEWRWNFSTLKKFTAWLLLLGVLFLFTTFLDRFNSLPPSAEEKSTLLWIEDHTSKKEIVFSMKENEYFIRYFAKRSVVSDPKILAATYINELFPLLEENNISIIYITKDMRRKLTEEQGFLFLLKNERFKLAHASKEAEVWLFR